MADNNEEIDIKIVLDTANSATDIKTLNKSLKDLISLQGSVDKSSPDFKKLQKAINDTEGKIGDLKDAFETLRGSGVERLGASFGQLKEGFSSWDTGKIKGSLNGISAAFKAIPIFLILEGIRYLIENFDELSKGSGFLGKALRFVGDIISSIVDAVYELTDALGLTNSALDKQGEAIEKNSEKAKTALERQTKEYDNQIAAAKAAGKSTINLEIAKQEAIVKTNKALVEQTIAYVRSGGKLTEEQKNLLTEQINAIKDAKAQEVIITATAEKEKSDKWKQAQEEKKKLEEKAAEDHKKYLADRQKIEDESNAAQDAALQYNADLTKQLELEKLDAIEAANAAALNDSLLKIKAEQDAEKLKNEEKKKAWAEEKANMAETFKEAQAYAQLTIATVQGISDLKKQKQDQELEAYNQQKQSELDSINSNLDAELAKEGLTEQQKVDLKNKAAQDEYNIKLAQYNQNLAIKKKEFENGKKMAIAMALISGAVAAVNALSAAPFFPMAIIGLAMATITTVLSVAKIASQKFDGGGAPPKPPTLQSAAGSSGLGGGNSASANNQTSFLPPGLEKVGADQGKFNNPNNPAKDNMGGNSGDAKEVYVVSTTLTGVQNKDEVLKRRRTI